MIRFPGGLFLPLFFFSFSFVTSNSPQLLLSNWFLAVIMGQKRGRDSKPQAAQSKKRQKAGKLVPASDDGSWDGVAGVEDLNWKEVALPDRMEDAGGFFGLEEIDGVDVIKTEGSAGVQFKVSNFWC